MFSVDNMSKTPVYEQIIEQVEKFILLGLLKSGDGLPSVRGLSVELSINPNTIQKSYSELTKKGIAYSVPGKGLYISQDAAEIIGNSERQRLKSLETTIKELKLAGISKEEILSIIHSVYSE